MLYVTLSAHVLPNFITIQSSVLSPALAQGDISVFTIISFTAYRVSYDYIQGVSVLPCTSAFPQMKLYTPGPIYNGIHWALHLWIVLWARYCTVWWEARL